RVRGQAALRPRDEDVAEVIGGDRRHRVGAEGGASARLIEGIDDGELLRIREAVAAVGRARDVDGVRHAGPGELPPRDVDRAVVGGDGNRRALHGALLVVVRFAVPAAAFALPLALPAAVVPLDLLEDPALL